jgi:hypothetical protein
MGDPMMLILLFVSMIGIAIVVVSTVMRERSSSSRSPQNQRQYMAPPYPQAAMIPPPPPASRNNGDEYSQWIDKMNRLLIELRSTDYAVCGNCGRSLKNPNGTFNIASRFTYHRGYRVREVFCMNCGAAILEQEPKVKPPNIALRQEAEAVAPARGTGFDIVTQRRETPAQSRVEELARQVASEVAPEEAGEYEMPEKLQGLSDKALIRLMTTCGGCIHYDGEAGTCKAAQFSGRNYKIKRTHGVCRWWAEQRYLAMIKRGEILVNDKYAEAYAKEEQ